MPQNTLLILLQLLIFPGFLFLIILAFIYEWIDRKFVARIQNRYGPLYTGPSGILQPLADFIKLLSKEDVVPDSADRLIFTSAPLFIFALPLTALLLIPIANEKAIINFDGDLIFLMFILTLIAINIILSGYGSASPYSIIGGVRSALQIIGYEIPAAISIIGPALSAGSLSISGIVEWQISRGMWTILLQPLGFGIIITCMLAELDLIPFDIPEAETEIVAGWKTEFSGRKLALLRIGKNMEILLASALIASLYLGGAQHIAFIPPIITFLVKSAAVLLMLSLLRAIFARFRIDQTVSGMWKYLMIPAIIQIMLICMGIGR